MRAEKIHIKAIDKYFSHLKNLDSTSKKNLIVKLNEWLDKPSSSKEINHLFGAWDDKRTAEEIILDIETSRTPGKEIEKF